MPTLVLLRHGQSQWNLENRFTGWVDVDLSERGEAEARRLFPIPNAGVMAGLTIALRPPSDSRTAYLARFAALMALIDAQN